MKALLIYNPVSGHHKIKKRIDKIKSYLSSTYTKLDIHASKSKDDFIDTLDKNISHYDDYIICGGDGTINLAINVVAKYEKRPTLAFIPSGTLNDAVRNLGNPSSFKKALNVIKEHKTKEVDIVKINDNYFSYCATTGAFSDIPVLTKNKTKKIFGHLAYYFKAIPLLFKKEVVEGVLKFDDNVIHFKTPFLLILNGKKMGGFKINKKASITDGKIDLIYGKVGLFNSLPQYFIRKKSLSRYELSSFSKIKYASSKYSLSSYSLF